LLRRISEEFIRLIAHYVFLDFASYGERIRVHKLDVFGDFEVSDLSEGIVSEIVDRNVLVGVDPGADFLAHERVLNPDDLDIFYVLVLKVELLNFLGVDVFTSSNDHVFDTSCDADVIVVVDKGEIARVTPAVLINRFLCDFWVIPVFRHDKVPFDAEFSLLASREYIYLLIDDLGFNIRVNFSNGGYFFLERGF
jgi:hypothetical protein